VRIERLGVEFIHGDLRSASDIAGLPACDWVIDAAANPSVLAGLTGVGSSRRLFEHNLSALGNVLEYCREHKAGLLLLSSSRVYSIPALAAIPLCVRDQAFAIDPTVPLPRGLSADGIGVDFSTAAPVSLYGATKLSSEIMALEYSAAFDFPVWITRCGVLAGAGQFGTPAQGIFAFWVNAHLRRRRLRYIGFDGTGYQARDAFHPRDLAALLVAQMRTARSDGQRVYTAGGGPANTMSLAHSSPPGATSDSGVMSRPSIRSHASMTFPGWSWTTPRRRGISAGKSKCLSPQFSKASRNMPTRIRSGWK
jgi:CDP-paratose 2-epimerase